MKRHLESILFILLRDRDSNLWIPIKLIAISALVFFLVAGMMLTLVGSLELIFWLADLGAYAT
jgi:hypothetical protein